MTQPQADGVYRHAFFMQRVGVGLTEALRLGGLNSSFLRNRLQLAQEVSVGLSVPVWKHEIVRLCSTSVGHVLQIAEFKGLAEREGFYNRRFRYLAVMPTLSR